MKITTLLIFAFILHVSASTFAQRLTIKQNNLSLKQFFKVIQAQTGYDVLYQPEKVNGEATINVDFKDTPLLEVLNKTLPAQGLIYSIDDKTIIVKKKEENAPDNPQNNLKAQPLPTVTVTGKVVDETGQPLPGVTVKIKNAANALTSTDVNGKFTVTVPDDKTVLVFSSIGYDSQELAAKDIPTGANITLKASMSALSEVQVLNKGYYFEKKELTTGDVSFVNSKTLNEQPVFDPLQALEGQVASLNIHQNSGVPGAYSNIMIRGVHSIANGTAPLFIIDGVPFNSQSLSSNDIGNAIGSGHPATIFQTGLGGSSGGQSPFSALNMDDIENIEVLKDADATAIYGSRGANGVIIITTKTGKPGNTKVNFNISQGIGQVGHFMDLMNTSQYLQMRRLAFTNDGLAVPSITTTPSNNQYDINGVWDTTRNTNWQKTLIGGTAHYTNALASVSGGNVNTQFLISSGYNRQTTVFPGNWEDIKGSLHLNLVHSSEDQRFRIQFSASYIHDNNFLPALDLTNDILFAPDAPAMYNANGSINWQFYNNSATFGSNPAPQLLKTSDAITNNLVSNVIVSYLLLPGLTFKTSLGYTYDEMNENEIIPANAYAPPNNTSTTNRFGFFSNTAYQTWIIEPQFSYQKKVAKGTLNVLFGGTAQQNLASNTGITAFGYSSDALIIDPAAASTTVLDEIFTQYRYTSLYGRIGYDWDEKYLLNITARRDGSSRFGPGKEFGNFGAIGGGWIFSKEKFFKDASPWLNFGKLRLTYGTSGNDQITDYAYLSTYNVNSTSYLGNTGLAPAGLTNPYFAWEVVKKLEGGIDLGFFQDRIDLSVNYYRDRTGNQLVGYPLSSVTGFTTIQYNLPAVIQNTGLEVQLSTVNIRNKNFSWTSGVNFTLPNNKLVSYPGIASSNYRNTYIVGQSLFIQPTYQYAGINPQTGLYSFATANANGTPSSPQEQVFTAPVTQKYYGGIQNNFTYKDFGLDIFFQFVDQLTYSAQRYFPAPGIFGSNSNELVSIYNNEWTKPGDQAVIQRFTTNSSSYNLYTSSTAAYVDGSFVRLKNASLYYKFPLKWQQWAHMQNARIYLQGQNLFTLTKYAGLDPETSGLTLPPLRVIMAGVNASF